MTLNICSNTKKMIKKRITLFLKHYGKVFDHAAYEWPMLAVLDQARQDYVPLDFIFLVRTQISENSLVK